MDGMNYDVPANSNRKLLPGIIVLLVGIICTVIGAVNMFGGKAGSEDKDDAVKIARASETDEYAYVEIQYMTWPVAYYEAMESMQYYIVMDYYGEAAVVCLHDDDLDTYEPYIDWLYSDSYDNEPEEMEAYGYAQPFDYELKQLVMEYYDETFGEGIVTDDNFEEIFGEYYLYIGEKSEVYETATLGLVLLVLGVVALIVGAVMMHGSPKIQDEEFGADGPVVKENPNILLGIIGAIVGAAIGGVLWVIVGLMGYVSGWVAIAMLLLSYYGYKLLAHREDKKGMVISFVISMVMIFVAHYMTWCFTYYRVMNEELVGHTSFIRAMTELPEFMDTADLWGDFVGEMVLGYVFAIIVGIQWLLPGNKSAGKK